MIRERNKVMVEKKKSKKQKFDLDALQKLSPKKAFAEAEEAVLNNQNMELRTNLGKYEALCKFRVLCHKIREDYEYEEKIKKLVIKKNVEWDADKIEISVNRAICSNLSDNIKSTSSYKRYLYDAPRIIRIMDEKPVPLEETMKFLKANGIDCLANNRLSKNDKFENIKSSSSSKVLEGDMVTLEEIKQNCGRLIKIIKAFLK